ncbi:MAG: 5'-nucleotidase C-terminal domain-containing protein [Bacteroides sp.]|nr:5'-nucleotidase C-terminal domain-containing protein [Roseburia sp.]MCM1347064.1 5'-nucleotidase C-terminal domain-containing protein [Bacteroides sp.]MCM1420649.1 5'-nucleotidase C-terminal domain-containing protein [Bacteroides sp.]
MESKTRKIKIIFTSDIHGNYFPYDFRHERWGKGSLQRVHAFVAQQCRHCSCSTILIDGGDILQGEPTAYYFNYVSPGKRHKVADFCNFIGYDVGVIGNHDIETGHEVFNSFIRDCNYPILGANAISVHTGKPYFKPYTILYRSGVRIAVVGFITPAIPHWVPIRSWDGIEFENIKESACKWIKIIKETENPDFIIGLFHSGMDDGIVTPEYRENATRETVTSVDGFDLVLYGHDHASNMEEVESPSGKSVLCVNPGSFAYSVAEINLRFALGQDGHVIHNDMTCQLHYIGTLHNLHASEFRKHFNEDCKAVHRFASRKLGTFLSGVDISDAYFGSSAYIDLIHRLQLRISGADISFAAPLFFNASIEPGDVKVNNLFNMYRFEDCLYTLRMSGHEIKRYLEMSYACWTNQMTSADDNLLLIGPMKNNPERIGFKNFLFNFDSAAGIKYEVDVTQPEGEKVRIICMGNGTPFYEDREYTVAMTAYRANGGGELLTKGAGIAKEDIKDRIVSYTEKDIRHYLMQYIKEKETVTPKAINHWRFVPEDWVAKAAERERKLLFEKKEDNVSSQSSPALFEK